MRAVIKGQAVGFDSFVSKKKGRKVFSLDLYDGRDVTRVNDVPEKMVSETVDLQHIEIPVRIYPGDRLYVVYDNYSDKAQA